MNRRQEMINKNDQKLKIWMPLVYCGEYKEKAFAEKEKGMSFYRYRLKKREEPYALKIVGKQFVSVGWLIMRDWQASLFRREEKKRSKDKQNSPYFFFGIPGHVTWRQAML